MHADLSPTDDHEAARIAAAEKWVHQLRAFYVHAAVAVVATVGIFIVNLVTNLAAGTTGHWWAWWSMWVVIGWTPGVAIHGVVVRLARPKFESSAWEQRQIDQVLAG